MSSDPVEELATVLGLTDDSFLLLAPQHKRWKEAADAPDADTRPFPSTCLEINLLLRRFHDLVALHFSDTGKLEQIRIYVNAFLAKYLPQLVQALLLIDPDALADSPWFHLFAQAGPNAVISHFMRVHELAPRLQLHLLNTLYNEKAQKWGFLAKHVKSCLFALSFPTSTPQPPFPWSNIGASVGQDTHSSSLLLVGQLLMNLCEEAAPSARVKALKEVAASCLIVAMALKSSLPPQTEARVRSGLIWSGCERHSEGGCVDTGEEMMACSGCLTVRYCSREHQRADWKGHKPECVKPSWAT